MILLLSLIILPIISIYLLRKTRTTVKVALPPGPPTLPLIGNLHQLATVGDLHIYLWRLAKKFNSPIIHFKLGHIPLIVVSSPELAKEVLKTQDSSFCSRPKSLGQTRISYSNTDIIFSPYNPYWKEMRKITSIHLFTPKKVQSFRPIREDEVSRMITGIRSFSCSSSGNRVVNLNEMAMAMGSTLICRVAFGKRYDAHGSEMRRFKKLIEEAQAIAIAFYFSDYFPVLSWVDKLSGLSNRVDTVFKKLDLFYQELIDECLHPNRAKTLDMEDNILEILIKLKEEQFMSSSNIQLTWDNIKALLMNIFIAGTDTSSGAIVWVMTALMKSPNAMRKLQAEIRKMVGEKGKVDEDDIPKLPYLKAVINETLRLYPIAPLLVPRETTEKCVLHGYEIGPKTMVYVNAWAIARDPEYWEDPDEFVPERFLNSNIDIKGKDFRVIPFGAGRRMCPGMSMGLAVVELTVANLLYNFDWELPPGIPPEDVDTDASPGLAVQKKNPLLLVPKNYSA